MIGELNMENPFQNNLYNIFESAPTPKVELELPLFDSPIDISDWSSGISPDGVPIVKPKDESAPYRMSWNFDDVSHTTSNPTQSPVNNSSKDDDKKLNNSIGSRQKQAMKFFTDKGLTNYQAAGIVGNLMHESGDKSLGITTSIGDGGRSIGLGQWKGSRRRNLQNFAKSKGKSSDDFMTQLEFIWEEMTNPDFGETGFRVLDRLKRTNNVKDATNIFMIYYERPGIPNFSNRLKHARSLIEK